MEGLLGNFQRIQTFQNQEQQQLFEDKVRKYEQYPKPTNRKEGYQNLSSNSSFLQFSYSHCFSLELLIAAIKTNYIRLFNGQIILILQKIIEHFQLKQSKAIHHGNIQPRNIIIELQVDDQFKTLTTYARPINIKRIYFTNYILNQTESDGDNLKTIIVGFLELAEIRRNDKKLFQEDFLQQILKFPYYQIEETLQTLVIDSKKQYYQDSDQETGYFAPRYWWSKDYPYELEKIKKITESNDNMLDKVIQEETMKKNFFLNCEKDKKNQLEIQRESHIKFRKLIEQCKDYLINQFYEDAILIQMEFIGNYFKEKKKSMFHVYNIEDSIKQINNCNEQMKNTLIQMINKYYEEYSNSIKKKLFSSLEENIFFTCLFQLQIIELGIKLCEIEKINNLTEQVLKIKYPQHDQQSIKNIIMNQDL